MPTFAKPTGAALSDFNLRQVVHDDGGVLSVDILFSVTVVDSSGAPVSRPAGDLTPYLTAGQITAFTNAALNLYAKAKAELLA